MQNLLIFFFNDHIHKLKIYYIYHHNHENHQKVITQNPFL